MSNIKLFEEFNKNIIKGEGYDIESYIPDSKPVNEPLGWVITVVAPFFNV